MDHPWDRNQTGFPVGENLGFWLEDFQENWKVKMQEKPKERKSTEVWVTFVFVLLESNCTDDTKQPKSLENC